MLQSVNSHLIYFELIHSNNIVKKEHLCQNYYLNSFLKPHSKPKLVDLLLLIARLLPYYTITTVANEQEMKERLFVFCCSEIFFLNFKITLPLW